MELELRDYQILVQEKCRELLRNGIKRILVVMGTGSGKTETGAGFIQGASAKGRKVAVLDNRIQRVQQFQARLAKYGIDSGIIQGSNTRGTDRDVVVGLIDSVRTRGLPDDIKLLLVDECHYTAGTKEYLTLFKDKVVIGMTGSPWAKGLGKHHEELGGPLYEAVVVGRSMVELMADGWLLEPEIWSMQSPDMKGVKTCTLGGEKEYNADEMGERFHGLIGDVVETWLRLAPKCQTIVFSSNIKESLAVRDAFINAGVAAKHVDYRMDPDIERPKLYDEFANREFQVLCNVALLGTGFDCPVCDCVVLNKKYKSKIGLAQTVGRVLRKDPANPDKIATIIDHGQSLFDFAQREGLPWEWDVTTLDDGSPKDTSQSVEDEEKHEPTPTFECPNCRKLRRNRTIRCTCGHMFTQQSDKERGEGEAVKLSGKKAKLEKHAILAQLPKQEVYSQLLHHAQQLNRKRGWVANSYKEIFGIWPIGLEDITLLPCPEIQLWIRNRDRAYYAKNKRR